MPHVVSEESFFEGWLAFAPFHRARSAAQAAISLRAATDPALRATLMLDLLAAYGQAFEDFVIWSGAVRETAGDRDARLEDILDHIPADWAGVLNELGKGTRDSYLGLWDLPQEASDPAQQTAYNDLVTGWASIGRRVAQSFNSRTRAKSQIFKRVLNKTKHGMYLSAVHVGPDLYLVFHPEAGKKQGGYLKQIVNDAEAAKLVVQTYTVNKLLAATLRQVFVSWYGRIPEAQWVSMVIAGADELTPEGILRITTTTALLRTAD